MNDVLSEEVSIDELRQFEKTYYNELYQHEVTPKTQFEYSWCLVRSKYPTDIRKGILLLEELCKTNPEGKRDYLYYLAIGNARVKEYSKALNYIKFFLSREPGNQQILHLETVIKKKMDKEGALGIAVAGGLIFTVGAIAVIGMTLAGKK